MKGWTGLSCASFWFWLKAARVPSGRDRFAANAERACLLAMRLDTLPSPGFENKQLAQIPHLHWIFMRARQAELVRCLRRARENASAASGPFPWRRHDLKNHRP